MKKLPIIAALVLSTVAMAAPPAPAPATKPSQITLKEDAPANVKKFLETWKKVGTSIPPAIKDIYEVGEIGMLKVEEGRAADPARDEAYARRMAIQQAVKSGMTQEQASAALKAGKLKVQKVAPGTIDHRSPIGMEVISVIDETSALVTPRLVDFEGSRPKTQNGKPIMLSGIDTKGWSDGKDVTSINNSTVWEVTGTTKSSRGTVVVLQPFDLSKHQQ